MKQHTHLLLASLLVSLLASLAAFADETPGGRTGRFIFDARYIADTGSYLTNDTCHVALTKTANVIPDDTEVLVYARPIVSTNASDWVQLLPLRTIAEHPADYYLANAISNDVMVTANYVPPSPVITNFLFTTACKICLGITPTTSLPLVVPHAKAIAVDSFDSRVEYLASNSRQSCINTGIYPDLGSIVIEIKAIKETSMTLFGNNGTSLKINFTGSGGRGYCYYGTYTGNYANYLPTNPDAPHVFLFDRGTLYIDGELIGSPPSGAYTYVGTAAYPLGLWGRISNADGTTFNDAGYNTIYYCKIWNKGVLVRDFYPVRVDSTGYLFDAVSGKLFGNIGRDPFLVGPDL